MTLPEYYPLDSVTASATTPLPPAFSTFSVIGADDDRTEVTDSRRWPYRSICSLEVHGTAPGVVLHGSGFFIGPHTVITAAHNLRFDQIGWRASSVVVAPGRDRTGTPFGSVTAQRWELSPGWTPSEPQSEDYAAVFLDDDALGRSVGWLAVPPALTDEQLAQRWVAVSGYPWDAQPAGYDGTLQFIHGDSIIHIETERFYYPIDTSTGDSGGPVLTPSDRGPLVIGIHTYGIASHSGQGPPPPPAAQTWNACTRITSSVRQQLAAWV